MEQAMFLFGHELMRRLMKREGEGPRELSVLLDKESAERLDRLRSRLVKEDDNELAALALRCLEQRVDSIIRKRVMKSIQTIKAGGISTDEVPQPLNQQGIPTFKRAILTKIKGSKSKQK